jgi:hypothetical protein
MKKQLIIALGLLLSALPPLTRAQSSSPGPAPVAVTDDTYGPLANENEFTLSGGGSGDKHFNNSLGSLDLSLGHYVSDSLEIVLHQTASYANVPGTGASGIYSTRVALDENLFTGPFRPFAGINFGGVYGNGVTDTFAAGLEGGVKYYVMPKTFVFALLDYSFLFRSSNQISDRFGNGAFFWNAGVGFNF